MDDPFDEVFNADQRAHQDGHQAGSKQGLLEGRVSGFSTGQTLGMEVGDEMGYYLGFAEKMLELKLEDKDDRLKRLCTSLLDEVKGFHCLDLSSQTYQEDVRRIRGKFKQVSSILKFKSPEGLGKSFTAEQSF